MCLVCLNYIGGIVQFYYTPSHHQRWQLRHIFVFGQVIVSSNMAYQIKRVLKTRSQAAQKSYLPAM